MKTIPDRWIVITVDSPEFGTFDRVLAGWYGGYTGSDSWQINSGIAKAAEYEDRWEFDGYSGSVYVCYKHAYGLTGLTRSILESLIEKSRGFVTINVNEDYGDE